MQNMLCRWNIKKLNTDYKGSPIFWLTLPDHWWNTSPWIATKFETEVNTGPVPATGSSYFSRSMVAFNAVNLHLESGLARHTPELFSGQCCLSQQVASGRRERGGALKEPLAASSSKLPPKSHSQKLFKLQADEWSVTIAFSKTMHQWIEN